MDAKLLVLIFSGTLDYRSGSSVANDVELIKIRLYNATFANAPIAAKFRENQDSS
jgi:hypothetical protein